MSIRQKQLSITLNRIHFEEDIPFVSVLAISVLNGVKRSKRDGLVKNPLILPLDDLRQMVTARDTVWMANSLKSLGTGSLSNLVTERNRKKPRAYSSRMSIAYALYALRSVAPSRPHKTRAK